MQSQPKKPSSGQAKTIKKVANLPKPSKAVAAAPVAYSQKQVSRDPVIVRRSPKETCIRHRELIGTVNGSIAFTANKYPLNPGMAVTFPWLSTQAALWDQYRFRFLKFEYVTRTATSTVGSILLVPDYDPDDSPPTTEAVASAHSDTVEDVCWKSLTCTLDPVALNPFGAEKARRYVRSFAQAGDLATFDSGNFYLCTVEQTGASAIGKLWVEYEVDLFKPQLNPSSPTSLMVSQFYKSAQSLTTAVAVNFIPDTSVFDPLGLLTVGTPLVDGNFTPPKGAYKVSIIGFLADGTNETATIQTTFKKNGANLTPNIQILAYSAGTAAGERVAYSAVGVVTFSGADTFAVSLTATGAAGALTHTATLLFELA